MPSSDHKVIEHVIGLYREANPLTVLDVGVGYGKWGHMFREYGDIMYERWEKTEWRTVIHGVEIYERYITSAHHEHYNHITIGDISKIAGALPSYDFIYAGDVIEHLPKPVALDVIETLRLKSKTLVLSIPLGLDWHQGEVFGNEAEAHLSTWTERDFEGWAFSKVVMAMNNKPIGVFASC